MTLTPHTKRFRIDAVIKYRVPIGVIEAADQSEALKKAMQTPEWDRASQHRGGVWDVEFHPLTDEERA